MADYESGISVAFVRACFSLDPDTGKLFWAVRSTGRRAANIGDEAGCLTPSGYYKVSLFGRLFPLHRVVWAHWHGSWPISSVDHINGNPGDNRIINLRLATNSQNQANSRKNRRGVTSQFKGVGWSKKNNCWRARLKDRHLGHFGDEYSAARAYDYAAKECFGEYAKLNFEENAVG